MNYFLVCLKIIILMVLIVSCAEKPVDDDTLLIYARSVSLYNTGNFSGTVSLLNDADAVKKMDGFVPAIVLNGKSEYFLGNLDSAEKYFKRAIKLRPSQKESSVYLARILREKGDVNGAKKIVEKLLADDPADVSVLRFASELTKDDSSVSLSYLNRAASAGEESALVLLERARRNWVLGKTKDALSDINGAKALAGFESPLFRAIENLEKTVKGRL
jgi:tetratricopeptide (TPR) repeat protein